MGNVKLQVNKLEVTEGNIENAVSKWTPFRTHYSLLTIPGMGLKMPSSVWFRKATSCWHPLIWNSVASYATYQQMYVQVGFWCHVYPTYLSKQNKHCLFMLSSVQEWIQHVPVFLFQTWSEIKAQIKTGAGGWSRPVAGREAPFGLAARSMEVTDKDNAITHNPYDLCSITSKITENKRWVWFRYARGL